MVNLGNFRTSFQPKSFFSRVPARAKSFSRSETGPNPVRDIAVRSNSTTTGNIVISPHPDAIRRRKEAERRRQERAIALETTIAALQGKSLKENSSNLIEITDASELNFRLSSGSRNDGLVVAHFKASWCSACARMQYKVGQIAEQNPDVTFLVIDVSKSPELLASSAELGVEQLPYFLFYKNKECVSKFTCNLSKIKRLRDKIDAFKSRPSVSLLEQAGGCEVPTPHQ